MTQPLISVVIPTYEMKGQGLVFLIRALESINRQTGIDPTELEIVISDQSDDKVIAKGLRDFASPFPMHYYPTTSKRGYAAHNLNQAIGLAKGEFVKILFQDDVLVQTHYLESVLTLLREQHAVCLVTGAVHTRNGLEFENPVVPAPNPYFLFGNNTMSSPSVLTLERAFALAHPFDESLKMLFDCAFYYELFASNTKLVFAPELQIANGIWDGQAQHTISFEQMTREVRYLHDRYPQANLPALLPAYQAFFKNLHPQAPFPFLTNLAPTPWERIAEWLQSHLHR